MKKTCFPVFILLAFWFTASPCDAAVIDTLNADILQVAGNITNSHGEGVEKAMITITIETARDTVGVTTHTDASGHYMAESLLPGGTLASSRIYLEARKSSYAPSARISLQPIAAKIAERQSTFFLADADLTLRRITSPAMWISAAVLLMVYLMIGFEWVHRTLTALLGATLLLAITYLAGPFYPELKIISFENAVSAVDMNVILLLFAMMIIVGISETSGMFQWLAYKCFEISRGRIPVLAAALVLATALTSAFLDNVTTMLLVIPVTLKIASVTGINPLALLMPEVFASNIGGAATLIGDPPNIMIGSYAGLTFMDFLLSLSLPCGLVLAVSITFFLFFYRRTYSKAKAGTGFDAMKKNTSGFNITNKRTAALSLLFLAMTILLFIVHGILEMAPCIAAMTGATLLLITSGVDITELLEKKIEWSTLIFFALLFVIVAAAEETGLIYLVAEGVGALSGESLSAAILLVLWVSAIASAVIDNIPFTATMLPVVGYLGTVVPGAQEGILWWALSMGACLGGNGTMIGASANVVTVGMAEKAGHRITFAEYLRICAPPMLISIVICSAWLLFLMI